VEITTFPHVLCLLHAAVLTHTPLMQAFSSLPPGAPLSFLQLQLWSWDGQHAFTGSIVVNSIAQSLNRQTIKCGMAAHW